MSSSDEESYDYPESVGSNNSEKESSRELSTEYEKNLDEDLDSIESLSSTFEDDYEDNNINYQEKHVTGEENISPTDQTIEEIKKLINDRLKTAKLKSSTDQYIDEIKKLKINDRLALKPEPKPELRPVPKPALTPVQNLNPVIDENQTLHLFPTREKLVSQFTNHVRYWGALIRYNRERFQVTNTCNIDYYLLAFWVMDVLIPDFSNNIPQLALASQNKEIIRYIDLLEWNMAREIWILYVMRYNLRNRRTDKDREINLLNSEREIF